MHPLSTHYGILLLERELHAQYQREHVAPLACIKAAMTEMFVVGYYKDDRTRLWGFVVISENEHLTKRREANAPDFQEEHRHVESWNREYLDAGQDQRTYWCPSAEDLEGLLGYEHIQAAAASMMFRVMRKRATINARFHCQQLADSLLDTRS